jgi:hypothetical protein
MRSRSNSTTTSNPYKISPSGRKVFVGLFQYVSRETTDISFNVGDRMELLDDRYQYKSFDNL